MTYTILYRLYILSIILSTTLLLTSCHVVKYELPLDDQVILEVKRKRSAFPPDSIWRDLTFCKIFGEYNPLLIAGFSSYRGDTLFHENDIAEYTLAPESTESNWWFEPNDHVTDSCKCQLKDIKRNR